MYLLDTCLVSELRRPERADPRVLAWAAAVPPAHLYLSVITIRELELGILQIARRDARQGDLLRDWLERMVLPAFGDRILPVDLAVARRCARMHVPDPRPERDAMIAATADVHRLVVATRNSRDFPDVASLNPWAGH